MSRPPEQLEDTTHERGCAGREYACTCGYDDAVEADLHRLRARVAELEADKSAWRRAYKFSLKTNIRLFGDAIEGMKTDLMDVEEDEAAVSVSPDSPRDQPKS